MVVALRNTGIQHETLMLTAMQSSKGLRMRQRKKTWTSQARAAGNGKGKWRGELMHHPPGAGQALQGRAGQERGPVCLSC